MTELQKKDYKKILLQTMKDFIELCEENNIKYVAAFGTVLGAVRHQGLIPWDDDIDVYMTREDYNKFLSLKDKLGNSSYEIIYHKDKNYYLPFAKFCNKNTTLWELKEFPFIMGVFVDVFPLDYASQNDCVNNRLRCLFKKYWTSYLRSFIKPRYNKYLESIKNFKYGLLISDLLNFIYKPFKNIMYSHFINVEGKIHSIRGGEYILYETSIFPIDRFIYKKSWIEDTIEVPFEDFYIKIPKEYHEYLRHEYSDYMQLPPLEKRISNHSHYYIDLTKRLSIKEICQLN